jgi:hypothetical protein
MRRAPRFLLGLFVGALLGYLVKGLQAAREEFAPREPGGGGRGPAPHALPARPAEGAEAEIAKVHFMKKFVAALRSPPENAKPNPRWTSPLADSGDPIECRHCHDATQFDFDAMQANLDPGREAVEPYRRDRSFMVPLMERWVERLNERNAERLRGVVTCTTCHAEDPRGAAEAVRREEVYAYFMRSFLRALEERPGSMREPAERWRVLVKEPGSAAVRCSTCHADASGLGLDARYLGAAAARPPRPEAFAADRAFMTKLMERWVEKLNHEAASALVKVVVCRDCHERDPRH